RYKQRQNNSQKESALKAIRLRRHARLAARRPATRSSTLSVAAAPRRSAEPVAADYVRRSRRRSEPPVCDCIITPPFQLLSSCVSEHTRAKQKEVWLLGGIARWRVSLQT